MKKQDLASVQKSALEVRDFYCNKDKVVEPIQHTKEGMDVFRALKLLYDCRSPYRLKGEDVIG